jgi:hypothetical protein
MTPSALRVEQELSWAVTNHHHHKAAWEETCCLGDQHKLRAKKL